ncbi:ParB/RepB/Spo0J family partition protein [Cognatishimia sp. MH4019]|uniref:ParB/RepB/Spo0J family partition protein n=1 Tax=Cognatishimia sp. MH4019 TaxID=2854030 RepID=UPI001CD40361|nr:ParB N-terminal domain-containing protein [Cognatishimia sp. MH4019]
MTIEILELSRITVADRLRSVDEDWAQAIAQSILVNGLMEPLIVRPLGEGQFALVAGAHRYRGLAIAGLDQAECKILELSEAEARLAEIDENLIRRELTALDRAIFLTERKSVYEKLHPETAKGGDLGNQHTGGKTQTSRLATFTEDAAEKMGLSQRSIQDAIALVKSLEPKAISLISSTPLASNAAQLKALSKLQADQQYACAARIASGDVSSVKEWQIAVGDIADPSEPAVPRDAWFTKTVSVWGQAKKRWKRDFVAEYKDELRTLLDELDRDAES